MIEGLRINDAIVKHKEAYQNFGLEPSPFRITCREHKDLMEYMKPLMKENQKPSMIAEYYGVKIEVVMIVDAYI